MTKAPPPNYTQSPNIYFDKWLREINSLAELKVVNAIMRNTFGWHEKETTLTFSELQQVTGLSRGGLTKGIQLAQEHGYIERTDGSRGRVCTYKIAIQPAEKHESETSLQNRLVEPETSLRCRPELVHEIDRQLVYKIDCPIDKEKEKESRKKEDDPRGYPFDHFAVIEYQHHFRIELPIMPAEQIATDVADTDLSRMVWSDTLRTFKGNNYQPKYAGNALDRYVNTMREIAAGKRESPILAKPARTRTLAEQFASGEMQ